MLLLLLNCCFACSVALKWYIRWILSVFFYSSESVSFMYSSPSIIYYSETSCSYATSESIRSHTPLPFNISLSCGAMLILIFTQTWVATFPRESTISAEGNVLLTLRLAALLLILLCLFVCVSPASCPVLCSGNGQYLKGRCMCHSGWKGSECDVPTNQCIDITCSGHGTCIVGTCICNPGYKGENCEEGIDRHEPLCLKRCFTMPYNYNSDS